VEGGFRAIKFNRITGVGEKVYGEGINFMIPGLERPIIYDVRSRPEVITSLTGSKDLQMVDLTVRVLYKPNIQKLQNIYRELGLNYGERVLPSIGNEVLKSVVAQFTAAELLTLRSDVSSNISSRLSARSKDFGIDITDVSIINLGFGKEYTNAVEQKQVAQQEAGRAKFLVDKAVEQKKAAVIRAEGEAKAAELLGKAMSQNSGFLDLKRIQYSVQIAQIIANSQNKVMLPSDALLLAPENKK
jgi:regulator of protease activity HflC (stomatin/prohibitin superfamily)